MSKFGARRYDESWNAGNQQGSFQSFRDELLALCNSFEVDVQRPPVTHFSSNIRISRHHSPAQRAKEALREERRRQRRIAAVKLHTYLSPQKLDGRLDMSLAVTADPTPRTLALSKMTPDGKYHGVMSVAQAAVHEAAPVDDSSPFFSADLAMSSDDEESTPIPASLILQDTQFPSPGGRSYDAMRSELVSAYRAKHKRPATLLAAAVAERRDDSWNARPLSPVVKLADTLKESSLAIEVRKASSSRSAYDHAPRRPQSPSKANTRTIDMVKPPPTTLRGGDDSRITRLGCQVPLAEEPPSKYRDPSGIVLAHTVNRVDERERLRSRLDYRPSASTNPFVIDPKPTSTATYEALRRRREALEARSPHGFDHWNERRSNPHHDCVHSRTTMQWSSTPSRTSPPPLAMAYELGPAHGLPSKTARSPPLR